MYFNSLQALVQMDGHGGFVWSAYLITIAVIAGIIVTPIYRHKAILKQLGADLRRAKQASPAAGEEA